MTAHAPAPTPPAPATPTSTRHRLPALDVLRGIAILGTLLTNIWIFTSPTSPAKMALTGTPPAEMWGVAGLRAGDLQSAIQVGMNLVTDGKFIGLLTIMFGIGLEIQRQAAIRRGESWPGGYPWRAGLLVLDGLLNYIFIFEFDVLMGYGLTGLVVCVILATSPRTQKIWMVVGVTLHLVVMSAMALLMTPLFEKFATRAVGGGPTTELIDHALTQEWSREQVLAEATRRGLDSTQVGTEFARLSEMMRNQPGGSMSTEVYWDQVMERVTGFVGGRSEIPIMFLMGLGLFLVGAHLYRAGLFLPEGGRLRRRIMILSFGVGLPIDWTARLFFPDAAGPLPRYVTSTLVAFGVLALVAAFYARRTHVGRLGKPFEIVGKMALTCYIAQNLICSIIFYDWGFGLANRMPTEYSVYLTLAVYVGVCAILVTFSHLWLMVFSRGPVELVWHASYEAIMRRRGPKIEARAQRRAARRERRAAAKLTRG